MINKKMIDNLKKKIFPLFALLKKIDFFACIFLKLRKKLSYQSVYIVAHDAFMAFFSLFFTLYLKIGDEFLNYTPQFLLKNIIVFTLVSLSVFTFFHTQKATWKHINIEDLSTLNLSILVANTLYFPLMFLLAGDESFSKFVPLINVLVLVFLLNTPRLIVRLIHDQVILQKKKVRRLLSIPVLIIGDEDHSALYIRDIRFSDDSPYDPVGILTTTQTDEQGLSIHNVPILGTVSDFEIILPTLPVAPRQLIIVDQNMEKAMLKNIAQMARKHQLATLRLPQNIKLDLVDENTEIQPARHQIP
ncbi:MAG: hypothetical protein CNLJKLNK_01127 [Holosporales bacterium]